MMRLAVRLILLGVVAGCMACTVEYTPKPCGYFRIEPPIATYRDTSVCGLPFSFRLSGQAVVKEVESDSAQHWFYITYPALNANLYCGYLSGTKEALVEAYVEFLRTPDRLANAKQSARTPEWSLTEENLYGELFCDNNNLASPMQFVVFGDSSKMLRGMLFYDCALNADSLAPVNAYLKQDIIELLKSFMWTD